MDDESGKSKPRVLVTGGTGYLAGWVIAGLMRRGYRTRTTVRRLDKIEQVRESITAQVDPATVSELEFAVADLLDDAGWDNAVADMDYVVHTASPLAMRDGKELIHTAREGVRNVMSAAGHAGVRRVVLTSSAVAAIPENLDRVADETVWAVASDKPTEAYNSSKILAEHDAWELARDVGVALTTILPTFMQGPVLGTPAELGSTEAVRRLLTGGLPAIPNIGWDIVDVRDIADLHILAMAAPAAAGERLLGSGSFLWWRDVAALLRDELPDHADKVPTRAMPDPIVRIIARFNRQMAVVRSNLHRQAAIDSSKARDLLGWESRPTEQTVIDTAKSLVAKGVVR